MTRPMPNVQIAAVKNFWEKNPVAASDIDAERGTPEYFRAFDALREDEGCEPYAFSEVIHGYSKSGGLKVLDVGCGNGYVLLQYARHGAEVFGVDLTAAAVRLSRQRFALAGLGGTFEEIDGQRLPFPDATFDIVCSMGVLHHISDPRPLIDDIYRVLKPGGQLIVMLYHRDSWKNVVMLRIWRLLRPRYRGKSQQEALNMNDGVDCPLARVYSKREAVRLLDRFVNHRIELNLLAWDQVFLLRPVIAFAKKLLPSPNRSWLARHFGWNLYVIATKSY